ncbi:toprim domain-containing protein [Flavobacterium sp. RHBU_24]|uniref:toprim domain-containing protein n=1 Tax=Flavobacterium sp. RHBU_24 TaxID=3391185 RepID=UPI003984BCB2
MEFREKRLTIAQAKEMDIVNCLSGMGIEPAKIHNNDYWYHSPLRGEKTPSFKVNLRLNRWYDHGIGKGGNLVDFAVLFWECNVSEALQKLGGNLSLQQQPERAFKIASEMATQIKILGEFFLSSTALLSYLEVRCINAEIANRFCREVRYELAGKTWYGIGFKNDLGGYEIRNAFQKLSSSPKGITCIKNGSNSVVVFEGFFDFLSFMVITGEGRFKENDFIILNSLALLESTHAILDTYKNVRLFLDNDAAGKAATQLTLSWGNHYYDESKLYEGYTDLNEWLVNAPKHSRAAILAYNFIKEKPPNLPKS